MEVANGLLTSYELIRQIMHYTSPRYLRDARNKNKAGFRHVQRERWRGHSTSFDICLTCKAMIIEYLIFQPNVC